MKRSILALVGLLALVGVVAFLFRTPIALRLMGSVLERNMGSSLLDELPDGLHVALCGAGSPLPDPKRSGPCTAVIAGRSLYIVDSGSGSSRVLGWMRIPHGQVEGVLLTHFHSDHIDGLGELLLQRWVNGTRTSPTPVHGPAGVEQVVDGLNRAYAQDQSYRVAHHGEAIVPPSGAGAVARPFAAPPDGEARVLVDDGELRITAFRVVHDPVEPAVGYRFDYKGRSVLLSGDTSKSANLQHFAEGVDLLVHEALAPNLVLLMKEAAAEAGRPNLEKIMGDILDYHASPVEAAEVARDTDAGHLLYYHVVPPLLLAPLEDAFLEGVDGVYDGPVTIGRDGTMITLEVGSEEIEVSELL